MVCINNCSSNGYCEDSVCICFRFYEGDDCSIKWIDDKYWYNANLFESIFTCVAQFIILLLSSIHLISVFRKKGSAKKVNSTFILISLIVAAIVRIVGYGPYIHYIRGEFSATAQRILFLVATLIWVNAAAMLILFWLVFVLKEKITSRIEILHSKRAEILSNVKRLRPFLFAIMIFTTVVILPVGVVASSVHEQKLFNILDSIWRGFLALTLLFIIISSSIFGFRLLRIVGVIYKTTKDQIFKEYIRRMTIELLLSDLFVTLLILSTSLFIVFDAEHKKWVFFIMEFGGRFFEFFAVLMVFLIVKRKKGGRDDSSTGEPSSVIQRSTSVDILMNPSS